MKRKAIAFFCSLILCFTALTGALPISAASAKEPEVTATSCAIFNVDNGIVMYSKNADKLIAPAPTVKLVSGIIAFEYYRDRMDEEITVTQEALSSGKGGFSIKLVADEIIKVRDLLTAMIIYNANDATCVLAYSIAGSIPNYVRMMNEKVAELGCTDTFFTNATGMDDQQMHTTVNDLVKIVTYCAKNTAYTAITSTNGTYTIPATNMSDAREIYNRNHMVSTRVYQTKYYNDLAIGLVAGATEKGGKCCVELFTWYGHYYAAIVMNAKYDQENDMEYMYSDAETLLNWGTKHYEYKNIADTKTMICELPVSLSHSGDHVALVPEQSVDIFVPTDSNLDEDVQLSWRLFGDQLQAPVAKGAICGILSVKYQGKVIENVRLVTKSEMPVSTFLRVTEMIKRIVTSGYFIFAVILAIFIAVLVVWNTAKRRGKQMERMRKRRS